MTSLSVLSRRANICEHVMLLHDNQFERSEAVISYVNDALRRGQFVICGSVNFGDESHRHRLVSRISNYKKNIDEGNLLVLELRELYNYARLGLLEPFEEIKIIVEEIVRERMAKGKIGEAVLIGDICGNLYKDGKDDECIALERWWDNTFHEWLLDGLRVSLICTYTGSERIRQSCLRPKEPLAILHTLIMSEIPR